MAQSKKRKLAGFGNVEPEKDNTMLYVGIGVVSVIGLSVAAYFMYAKSQKDKDSGEPVALPPVQQYIQQALPPATQQANPPAMQQVSPPVAPTPQGAKYDPLAKFTSGKYMPEVKLLQKYLISKGFKIKGGADGKYGPATQQVVANNLGKYLSPGKWFFPTNLVEVVEIKKDAGSYFAANGIPQIFMYSTEDKSGDYYVGANTPNLSGFVGFVY